MSTHINKNIPFGSDIFLSVLEGIEGGFAIFVGIVAGLYFQNISHDLLIVIGLISLIVNAFNSSAVRYASEHYIDELDGREKRNKIKAYFMPALAEFVTYAIVSLIAVLPLLLIADSLVAISLTIALTIIILFGAGWYRGDLLGRHAVRDGIELSSLGLAIILVGTTAGWLLSKIAI
ncbi:MAG: VIT1/CCC1 transporter family protein [Candidatus Saccharimonadales bacterium]